MKITLILIAVLLSSVSNVWSDILAQWNFNDTNAPTVSPPPSLGAGTAALVGGTTATWVGGGSADAGTPNKAWSTSRYPSVSASNKLAGVRFDVDTSGYENLAVSWYQENSDTASRYARLQYTLDGENFVDWPAGAVTIGKGSVYTNVTVNLGTMPEVNNNPRFGCRIVTEFESSALGSGTDGYVATGLGKDYSSGGTIHFDLVTVSGTLIPDGNTRPYIFPPLAAQTLRPGESTGPLAFSVVDAEEPADSLRLSVASSNPSVVPLANLALGGSKSERTVTVRAGSESGASLITIYVADSGGKSNFLSFVTTVLPANEPPTISPLPHLHTVANHPSAPLAFTVGDRETALEGLTVACQPANELLVPADPGHISLSRGATNWNLTLTPAGGQLGNTALTLSVSDGTNTTESVFSLMVTPSANVIFYEPFDYPDGPLLERSGFRWQHRATTATACQVTNGWAQLSAAQAEDPKAPLVGAPYAPGNGTVLYAAFKLKCLALPRATPAYFAHFAGGSTLRGRLYAGTTNALLGSYHLFVSNQSDTNTLQLAANLSTNTVYTVVLRYDIDRVATTFWVNPTAESDPGISALDAPGNPIAIDCFDFREDSTLGNGVFQVDELKVGLSFASVVETVVMPVALNCQRSGEGLVFSWSNPALGLAVATNVAGPYMKIPGAVSPWTNRLSGGAGFFRLVWP